MPVWPIMSSTVAMLTGRAIAYLMYQRSDDAPYKVATMFAPRYRFFLNKWYFDELYDLMSLEERARFIGFDQAQVSGTVVTGSVFTRLLEAIIDKQLENLEYAFQVFRHSDGAVNILAFFELPNAPEMGRDPNTPDWVQHIALEVDTVGELEATKARLEAAGIPVVGLTDHTIFKSIYFFDPNGHRLELAANTATPEMMKKLDEVKWDMLNEWAQTKRAPKHAAWMHDREFKALD